MSTLVTDIAVIGGGIAGASVAAEIARTHAVLLLEREQQPGYHTTGRSAAIYVESYGNAVVRALTSASRSFFESPPAGFADGPLWSRRGTLHIAGPDHLENLEVTWQAATRFSATPRRLSVDQALEMVPILQSSAVHAAFLEPDTMDLDVDRIHRGYLRQLKSHGGECLCSAEVTSMNRVAGGWQIALSDGRRIEAQAVVNAAGAWADSVASLAGLAPLGIVPKRRTALIVDGPAGTDVGAWPMVVDAGDQLYFKPEAGKLLVSPVDASPSPPCDVQPEELDVAITVDRLMTATSLQVRRIDHQWAGLRCFAADDSPVVGFDPRDPSFFWFAGQGGYGIQLAPALAELGASLLRRDGVSPRLAAFGVVEQAVSPGRPMPKIEAD